MPDDTSLSAVGSLELTLTCVWCGRPIALVASPAGVSLPDRARFVEVHARCLRLTDAMQSSPDRR